MRPIVFVNWWKPRSKVQINEKKNLDTRFKILTLPELLRRLKPCRGKQKIAWTNGCFDILHAGHVRYLESAKKKDRVLIVGLNSDASVRRIKGPNRPLNKERERSLVLAALSCVDFVVIFSQETPYKMIRAVKPDILIKGADWKGKEVVGSDLVKAWGGRVELVPYVKGFSTTGIIQDIVSREA